MNVRTTAAATTILLLAGCGAAGDPGTAAEPTVTVTKVETVEAAPSPTAASSTSPAKPDKTCADYAAPDPLGGASEEHSALQSATESALPDGMILNPGVQVVDSTSESGQIEAVVRICQDAQMSENELIEIASAVAVAIKGDPVSDRLEVLVVSSWHPDGEHLAQGESVMTDYGMYTWDLDAAAPMDTNWE